MRQEANAADGALGYYGKNQCLSRRRSSDVLSVLSRQVGRSTLIRTNLTEPDVDLNFS